MNVLLRRLMEQDVLKESAFRDNPGLRGVASNPAMEPGLKGLHSDQDPSGEYGTRFVRSLRKLMVRLGFNPGFRSDDSIEQERAFYSRVGSTSICVSVGGGPKRVHPAFLNLNVAPFHNVDLVGDAHALPFKDQSIDLIHVDAVLEHLKDPRRAVEEMHRVLKPDGEVFSITPFLQGYHGYPDHFQNLTVTGHELLFQRAGFAVIRSGMDLGPMNALALQLRMMISSCFPGVFGNGISRLIGVGSVPLRMLDPWICKHRPGISVGSTTFVRLRKKARGEGAGQAGA